MKKTTLHFVLMATLSVLATVMLGCKPKMTQEITIEIVANEQTPQEDVDKTLSIIKKRLIHTGLKYSAEDITAVEGRQNLYTIPLPESADRRNIRELVSRPGSLEFWRVVSNNNWHNIIPIDSIMVIEEGHRDWGNYNTTFLKGDTAMITSKLNDLKDRGVIPDYIRFAWQKETRREHLPLFILHMLEGTQPELTGEYIAKATAEQSKYNSNWEVIIKMDELGAKRWAVTTEQNVGRQIAITIDREVFSAPIVNAKIEGGNVVVSGMFTEEGAKQMAAVVNSKKLPLGVTAE